jgi:hypothetical protein
MQGLAALPGHGDRPGLRGMIQLSMTSSLPSDKPAIAAEKLQYFPNLHQ